MTVPLAGVVTNGGPLIALPLPLVDTWRGTLPPVDADVADGWVWGDGNDIVCDYDRACEEPSDSFGVGDSHRAWPVSVGPGSALVLDGECSTGAIPWHDGLIVVRDVGGASESELRAQVGAITGADWVEPGCSLDLHDGVLVLFDSAYGGSERDDADGGVLEARLEPGRYRLMVALASPESRTTFVRLAGPPQTSRGGATVVVR